MEKITRKEFLKKSAIIMAAGWLSPNWLEAEEEIIDVAIIGAGLAGLTAARELKRLGIKSIVVLEARDRVGGRTFNQTTVNNHYLEAGGQWIGPSQTEIKKLLRELNIRTFPTYTKGKRIENETYKFGWRETLDYISTVNKLERLANDIILKTPWQTENAIKLDNTTVADWLTKNAKTTGARAILDVIVSIVLGGDPGQISLLYFLFYVKSAGSIEALAESAQTSRIVGGSQSISLKLAESLKTNLLLNAPVTKVVDKDSYLSVYIGQREIKAKQIIIAMMPLDVKKITFDPPLPATREKLQQLWTGGSGGKYHVVYQQPFWRKMRFNGQVYGTETSAIGASFDNSPQSGSPGIMMIFPNESLLEETPEVRKQKIIAELVQFFGKKAANPIDYKEMNWKQEKWTGGCVSPLRPGVLASCGSALREPIGKIHWAGTETSEVWCGYMEGAIRSGQRVAKEIRTKFA